MLPPSTDGLTLSFAIPPILQAIGMPTYFSSPLASSSGLPLSFSVLLSFRLLGCPLLGFLLFIYFLQKTDVFTLSFSILHLPASLLTRQVIHTFSVCSSPCFVWFSMTMKYWTSLTESIIHGQVNSKIDWDLGLLLRSSRNLYHCK